MSPFLANFSFCFCPLSICERVHSLAAKIFCVCENVRPSLIQTKNGSSPLPFLLVLPFFAPFLPIFAPSRGEGKPFSPRVYIICQNSSLHLLPIFSYGQGKKMFHLHAFAPLSAIQCPPALRFPARFRKTIMLLFL